MVDILSIGTDERCGRQGCSRDLPPDLKTFAPTPPAVRSSVGDHEPATAQQFFLVRLLQDALNLRIYGLGDLDGDAYRDMAQLYGAQQAVLAVFE